MFQGTSMSPVRRAVIGAGAALALGVGAAAGATSAATAAPVGAAAPPALAPACATSALSAWVDADQSNGAAGTIAYPLEFTNHGARPCTLKGYPGVSAVNAAERQLGDAAGRDPLYKATLVTIPPGGTAHAVLFWHDAEVFSSGCKPAAASLVKVYPPNSKTAQVGFFSLQACTVRDHGYLSVSVVRGGPRLGL